MAATKGERDIVQYLIRDITTELFDSGWFRLNSPWILRYGDLHNHFEPRKKGDSEAIVAVGIVSVPLFPNKETGDADFARLVFLHVRELKEETMDSLIRYAKEVRTKVLSHAEWRGNIRDTEIIVLADKQEKGANYIFTGRARQKTNEGHVGSMVFSTKQSSGSIRKMLYGILSKWLKARAEGVQHAAEKSKTGKLYGALGTCVDYVSKLSERFEFLATRIKLLVRFKKPSKIPEYLNECERSINQNKAEDVKPGGYVKWRGIKSTTGG